MYLVDALNTRNPCLVVIRDWGYEIGLNPVDEEFGIGKWWAKKDDMEISASDPLALLGLVCLYEKRGRKWLRPEDPDIYEEVIDRYYSE